MRCPTPRKIVLEEGRGEKGVDSLEVTLDFRKSTTLTRGLCLVWTG